MTLIRDTPPGQELLWSTCPVPTCQTPVDDPRDVCDDCLAAFGALIRPSAEPVTAAAFAAAVQKSDGQARAALRAQREIAAEWKHAQLCWVCAERRKCRPDPGYLDGRMVCKTCLELT